MVSFNVWSGTDYTKDTTDFNNTCIESSTDWSYTGERSLKLTRVQDSYNYYTTSFDVSLPKSDYHFSCRLYAPYSNGQVIVTGDANVSTNFSSNKNVQLISVSLSNQPIVSVRFVNWSANTSIFIDEISINP